MLRNYPWAKALEEHQLIFEAALARDSEVASNLLKSHLRKSLFFSHGRQLEPFSIVFSTARPMLRPKDIGE